MRNLPLLSSEPQNEEDAAKIIDFLKTSKDQHALRRLAKLLLSRREENDIINIRILVQHINSLSDIECRKFFDALFSKDMDYGYEMWRERIGQVANNWVGKSDTETLSLGVDLLTFLLQISGFADWSAKEEFQGRFSSLPPRRCF